VRITLQTDGGLAFLPGLAAPITIDTDSLSREDADRWHELVGAARFWDLPNPTVRMTAARAPGESPMRDQRMYTLTVESGEQRRTLRFSDPVLAELAPLVRELLTRARKSD
jgi:hypothetical protein